MQIMMIFQSSIAVISTYLPISLIFCKSIFSLFSWHFKNEKIEQILASLLSLALAILMHY